MRFTAIFLFAFAGTFWGPSTGSMVAASRAFAPEIALNLLPPMVTAGSVKLQYEIPYPGYIEFYLFDSAQKKIWQDFGVRDKGNHVQSLKAEKFEKGKTYHFEFWYKGKAYPGKFSL
jgi:hypothetical protein